ncbi:hypothetical protein, partial [Clavibacter michiganensis]|uniref:hypothetical protein n=1 Tax=Clavibacter michiganensis TaxID=28447 RepID=UPI00292DAB52
MRGIRDLATRSTTAAARRRRPSARAPHRARAHPSAFGEPGKLPFWKGDGLGRPLELGRAIGAFVRE